MIQLNKKLKISDIVVSIYDVNVLKVDVKADNGSIRTVAYHSCFWIFGFNSIPSFCILSWKFFVTYPANSRGRVSICSALEISSLSRF